MSDQKAALNEYAARCPDCGGRLHAVAGRWNEGEQCGDCGRLFLY